MNKTRFAPISRPAAAVSRIVLIAVACASLVGCGPSAVKRDPIPIPTSALAVQGQPGTYGQTLVVALRDDLSTFNPYFQSDPTTIEVLHMLYAPLVGFNPVTGKVLPQEGLAQSFEATGRFVTIKLREGLNFSNGTPIRADDVVYSFKVAFDKEVRSPLADMFAVTGRLPEVTKVDAKTVKLEFTDSYPAIGYVLSQMPVISAGADPEKAIQKGRFEEVLAQQTPVADIACTGPFTVESYAKGKTLKLKYNPHYWKVDSQNNRLPYIDFVEYRFGLAEDEVVKGLQSGQINLAFDLHPKKAAALGDGDGKTFVVKDLGVGFGTWQLFGNMNPAAAADKVKVTWLFNPKFREFLSRIVDRDRISKEVFGGKATPAYSPITAANDSWLNSSTKKYPFDVTAAQAALTAGPNADFRIVDQGGKPQVVDAVDRKVQFNLYYPKTSEGEEIQKIVVDQINKAGVPVTATGVEPSKLFKQFILPGKFELVLWRMDGFGPDPSAYMPLFMMSGVRHYYSHTDADKQSLFDWEMTIGRLMRSQQDKTLDAERQQDFKEVQKLWAENNPVCYIVADHVVVAYDKRLGNIQPVTTIPHATWNAEQLFFQR
jgi:peptide/nickel transport system substrate-binding protein